LLYATITRQEITLAKAHIKNSQLSFRFLAFQV
jgi:hypothetical protein